MKTILLKLTGPLQSWGTNSNFETRNTDRYPSKSAVIGIIAASLGLRRNETEEISKLNSLDFAVRIDQPGSLLRDFHIATKYSKNGKIERTYVTHRYYLQDAVFVVAIGSNNHSVINKIVTALKFPYFQPFLGRRSLPLNADYFIKCTEKSVMESIRVERWHAAQWYKHKMRNLNKVPLSIYVDSHLLDGSKAFMMRDSVLSFSQKNRQHSFRAVSKTEINVFEEHDAFEALGGNDVLFKS
jgi:CRISPR system Cascade subunit CasD